MRWIIKIVVATLIWVVMTHTQQAKAQYAQSQNVGNSQIDSVVNRMYQNITSAQLQTGYLIERASWMKKQWSYMGDPTLDTLTNGPDWITSYYSFLYAYIGNNPTLPHEDTVHNIIIADTSNVLIGMLDMETDFIYPTSFGNGDMSISNNVLYVTPNTQPFKTMRSYTAAALRKQMIGDSISFLLPSNLYFSNITPAPSQIQIDFGNGSGYVTVNFDQPIKVKYQTSGTKQLDIKMTRSSEDFISQATIDIETYDLSNLNLSGPIKNYHMFEYDIGQSPSPNGIDAFNACGCSSVKTDGHNGGAAAYGELHGSTRKGMGCVMGHYYLYPGCDYDNTNPGVVIQIGQEQDLRAFQKVDKAVIILEGFDPGNKIAPARMLDNFGFRETADALRDLGYEVFIVDFCKGGDYIQNNGSVLRYLIQKINDDKVGNHPITVIGASMGGLVARYELWKMEQDNIDHEVGLYVSYDAPHAGANIPPSLQYILWGSYGLAVAKDLSGKDDLEIQTRALTSPAAQQLLLYRSVASVEDEEPSLSWIDFQEAGGLYQQLRTEMSNMAVGLGYQSAYPQHTRNVAITDGNLEGEFIEDEARQALQPYQKILNVDGGGPECGINYYSFDLEAYTTSIENQGVKIIAKFKFKSPFSNNVSERLYWYSGLGFAPDVCLDIVAGGTATTQRATAEGYDDQLDDGKSYVPYGRFWHSFIPSVSAIDLNENTPGISNLSDYFKADISSIPNILNHTPFDAIYGYQKRPDNPTANPKVFDLNNSEHADLRDGPFYDNGNEEPANINASWNIMGKVLRQEVQPHDLYLQNEYVNDTRYHEATGTVYAGRNVAPYNLNPNGFQRRQGDYTVSGSGDLEVLANEQIILEDGFDTNPGTTADFRIDNSFICLSGGRVGPAPEVTPEDPSAAARMALPKTKAEEEQAEASMAFKVSPTPLTIT